MKLHNETFQPIKLLMTYRVLPFNNKLLNWQ